MDRRLNLAPHKRIDDPRYTAAVVPTYVLAALADVARVRGLPFEPWFSGIGLAPQQAQDPSARVSYRQAALVIRRALRQAGSADLGLAVGMGESLVSFGVLGFAMLSCRTLADALALGMEHHQISGSLMDPEYRIEGEEVLICANERFADAAILPFLCEEFFGSTLMLMRTLIAPDFRPRRLELSYPAPAYADQYRRLFRCPVHFSAARNAVALEASWLGHELPTHNPITLAHALRLCREQTLAARSEDDIAVALAQWLRGQLQAGRRESADMRAAARALNLSERTLRRRLAQRGLSYREVFDRVRADAATALLREDGHSVAAIGAALGFSDAREFRRAYRRWTGRSPRQARTRPGHGDA